MSPLHLLASRKNVSRQRSLPSLHVAERVLPCSFTSLQVEMYEPGGSTPLDSQFRIPLILATPSAQRLASLSEVGSSRPSRLLQTACSVVPFIWMFLQLSVYDPPGCEGAAAFSSPAHSSLPFLLAMSEHFSKCESLAEWDLPCASWHLA